MLIIQGRKKEREDENHLKIFLFYYQINGTRKVKCLHKLSSRRMELASASQFLLVSNCSSRIYERPLELTVLDLTMLFIN